MDIQGVLWDMDGTLVDTEPYWIETETEVVERYGQGGWTHEDGLGLVGMDLRDAARLMQARGGVTLEVDAVVEALLDGVVARIRRHIPWRPGARELLAEMNQAGLPLGLVTMSWRRFTEAVLDALPTGSFHAVVTGDDVTRGKPHPEPYQVGAGLLGLDPRGCLALEDSPTGARSALEAGCRVVAIPNAVDVPARWYHHRLPTLEGVGMRELEALLRSARAAEPAR
jgi:HAD superfamily hydrolase (TIGR01509 family)